MLVGREAETQTIARLISEARDGTGGVLVLSGEAGIGKSTLLNYAESAGVGMQLVRAVGVQPEADIAYAGLHQLLLPLLDRLEQIPEPHAAALRSAFGLASGAPRDPFFVGMAALALLSLAAIEKPVLCLIDDAHQLDSASASALGFTARRMAADRVVMIFAVREDEPVTALQGLARMGLSALDPKAAYELTVEIAAPDIDASVAERIVAETAGQPLAIVELVHELSNDQLKGLAPLPELLPLAGQLEDLFEARLRALPGYAQTVLLLAAADPSGDPELVWRAAEEEYGLSRSSTDLTDVKRFVSCSPRIGFHHPLIRSAAYYGAPDPERRRVHEALAAASDPIRDADTRAWHLAAATVAPDEGIAQELERSAERARNRGGWASTANLMTRAAELSPNREKRAERHLAAAHARLVAGQPGAARNALKQAAAAPLDPVARARAARIEGMIEFTLARPADAAATLLGAARMSADHDLSEARATLLDAFDAAYIAGSFAAVTVDEVLGVARALPTSADPTVGDVLLDGFATLIESGDAAGVPIIRRALESFTPHRAISEEDVTWLPVAWVAAGELYDDRAWQALTSRWAAAAGARGCVAALSVGLGRMPHFDVVAGRFATAERMIAEARDLAAATTSGARPGGYSPAEVSALAWRGREQETRAAAAALIPELVKLGRGVGIRVVHLATAVLELGLGNYPEALRACRKVSTRLLHMNVEPELIEAAVRCGQPEVARAALDRLSARAHASGTDWGLGLMLRSQALLAGREEAEALYRGAIDYLSRTLVTPQLGRTYLLYGEWLRRQRRRRDAREQLRTAFDLLGDIGADAFAERARTELLATGQHARKRSPETLDQLTPQEEQIARMASEGASNTDIATQLFISVPTVAYHLQKAFRKLEIANRASLARALGERGADGRTQDESAVEIGLDGNGQPPGPREALVPSSSSSGVRDPVDSSDKQV